MLLLALGTAMALTAASFPLLDRLSSTRAPAWTVAAILGSAGIAGALVVCADRVGSVGVPLALGLASAAAVWAVQTVVDLTVHRLPRQLSYGGLVALLVAMTIDGDWVRLRGAALGAVAMTAVTGALVVLTRGSLGIGDLHLSPLLGAVVGWFSPTLVVLAWVVTALAGGVVVAGGLATGRLRRTDHVPYGPFMIAGSLVAVVIGALTVR